MADLSGGSTLGMNIVRTKLLAPSGTLLQENCGDTLSPTQFGLFG
jgi:hypothetical protein